MIKKFLLWLLLFIVLLSSVSAIDWNTDIDAHITLANYSESTGLVDIATNNYNATAYNGAALTISKTEFEFDGVNDYVLVPMGTHPIDDPSLGDFSLSAWIYADTKSNVLNLFNTGGSGGTDVGMAIFYDYDGSDLFVRVRDGTNKYAPASFGTINDDKWYHIVMTWDQSEGNINFFINNSNVLVDFSTSTSELSTNPSNNLAIGTHPDDLGNYFDGLISDVIVFNKELSVQEVSDLFSEGRNYENYVSSDYFSVTAKNYWTNESINDFWFYINGTNYTTSSGLVVTDIMKSDSGLYNMTWGSNNYNNLFYEDIEVTSNLVGSLTQSRVKFNAYEIVTDNYLNPTVYDINVSIEGVNKSISESYYLSLGEHNVTIIVDGYYPLTTTINVTFQGSDVQYFNVTGIYDTLVNITPLDVFTNISISGFNGWVYDNNNSYNVSFSSNNGSAIVGLAGFVNISYFINPDSYATDSGSFVINDTYYNLTTYHYTTNSVRINIYNDTTTNLLTQNVSIVGIFNGNSFVNSTLNGTLYVDLLVPESYELRFSSDDFVDTSLFITVTNDSTQEVNVYMVPNSTLDLQRVLVVDQISEPVSGAVVRLQEQVPGFDGLWVTVDEKSTSSDGYVGFYVEKSTNVFYRMIVIYDGEVKLISDATLFLPGIDEVVTLQISTLDSGVDNLFDSVVKSFVWSGSDNETFTFSWVDPNNFISGARLEVWVEDLNLSGVPSELYLINSSVLTTGSLSVTLPVVNDTIFTVKAYILYNGFDEFVYTDTRIFGSTTLPDRELGLILSLIVFLFVAFITISLKPLFSSVLSFSVLGIMSAFHLIVLPVTIITSFVALAIIFFVKIKGGGN